MVITRQYSGWSAWEIIFLLVIYPIDSVLFFFFFSFPSSFFFVWLFFFLLIVFLLFQPSPLFFLTFPFSPSITASSSTHSQEQPHKKKTLGLSCWRLCDSWTTLMPCLVSRPHSLPSIHWIPDSHPSCASAFHYPLLVRYSKIYPPPLRHPKPLAYRQSI